MTGQEAFILIEKLKEIFDVVRLVDAAKTAFVKRIEKVREEVTKLCLELCSELKLTVSIGAACFGETLEGMLERADKNLYAAKVEKNKVIL